MEMELSSMDKQKQTKSSDERLHDTEGGNMKGKVVYDNQPKSQRHTNDNDSADDEQSAESFPASDTPVHSDPTAAIGCKHKDK